MKTVGIITMHCVVNHGSALQTWATQEIIRRLGYAVKIINYRYPNEIHPRHKKGLKRILQFFLHLVQGFPQVRKRKLYEKFWKENFDLTKPYPHKRTIMDNPPRFDIYVAGSDQIWNPQHTNGDGTYFLDFVPKGKKKISYASSFSCSSLSSEYEKEVSCWLQSFDAISVREKNGVKIIDRFLPGKAVVTLDPTLLMTQKDYQPLIEKSAFRCDEPFILVYCLKYMYNPYPYATQFIEEAARQTGLKVICVDFTALQRIHARSVYNFQDGLGPSEFLWLFANASMVITTSFHGTAFALNFGKSVYSIVKDEKFGDDRMKSILELCGVPERIVPMGTENVHFDTTINRVKVQERLNELRKSSMDFLRTNL